MTEIRSAKIVSIEAPMNSGDTVGLVNYRIDIRFTEREVEFNLNYGISVHIIIDVPNVSHLMRPYSVINPEEMAFSSVRDRSDELVVGVVPERIFLGYSNEIISPDGEEKVIYEKYVPIDASHFNSGNEIKVMANITPEIANVQRLSSDSTRI